MVQVKSTTLDITELSRRTGLASSALRFYERRGLLKPVGRAGGKRVYDDWAIVQVAVVDLLKGAGFTLGKIAEIVDAEGHVNPHWRDVARQKLADLDEQIAFALRAKDVIEHAIACPHPAPDQCPVFQGHVAEHIVSIERRAMQRAGS